MEPSAWHDRGGLPHFSPGAIPQFITWRTEDSVPRTMFSEILSATDHLERQERTNRRMSAVEQLLDSGLGACPLKSQAHGHIVQDYLRAHDGALYDLHAWVVMPNHVHVLLTPDPSRTLAYVVNRIKGATSRAINLARGSAGTFWQADYFDRFIRDADHFRRVAEYIHGNPIKAGLCRSTMEWPLSSAQIVASRPGKFVCEERATYGEQYDPFLD